MTNVSRRSRRIARISGVSALLVALVVGGLGWVARAADRPTRNPSAPPASTTNPPSPPSAGTGTPAGPTTEPAAGGKSRPWPILTDEQQAGATAQRKTFAEAAAKKIGVELSLKETKYFLFYNNLDAKEAANWSGLLDRMYDKLAELFAVPKVKGVYKNIWRGKAVIFVFKEAKDYHSFHQMLGATAPATLNTLGMCFSYSNGDVAVGFFRQPDEVEFAHVLVHESVHGFVHRYKSPAQIPCWANEGLAEVIAFDLVEEDVKPERARANERTAKAIITSTPGLGDDFFTAAHISGNQYPPAHILTSFMIQQSKQRYVAFINGIKDGLTWEESLTQKYGVTVERLTNYFFDTLGVRVVKK